MPGPKPNTRTKNQDESSAEDLEGITKGFITESVDTPTPPAPVPPAGMIHSLPDAGLKGEPVRPSTKEKGDLGKDEKAILSGSTGSENVVAKVIGVNGTEARSLADRGNMALQPPLVTGQPVQMQHHGQAPNLAPKQVQPVFYQNQPVSSTFQRDYRMHVHTGHTMYSPRVVPRHAQIPVKPVTGGVMNPALAPAPKQIMRQHGLKTRPVVTVRGRTIPVNSTSLVLRDFGLKRITDIQGLDQLVFLEDLNLEFNDIVEIEGLNNLVNLKRLRLGNNKICNITGLENLKKLKVLRLDSNNISEIKGLDNLFELEELDLSRNHITDLKGLESLVKLKMLDLGENPVINKLFSLGFITDGNIISDPQLLVKYCQQLRIQEINRIKSMNPGSKVFVYNGSPLIEEEYNILVALENNLKTTIPQVSLNVPVHPKFGFSASNGHVNALLLSNLNLPRIPVNITKLPNLIELNLSGNRLAEVPEEIKVLKELRALFLGANRLSTLPPWFGEMTNLTILAIDRNRFAKLPDCMRNLVNLRQLYIGDNPLRILPIWIANYYYLMKLEAVNANLREFPSWIGKLQALEELFLYNNQITALNDSIGYLKNLRILGMAGNHLKTIPRSIGNLKSLEILDLKHNHLTYIPNSLEFLPRLKAVYLMGNPIMDRKIVKRLAKRGVFIDIE
ncbi:MAG: leucine-rich repeat domain-containing protein [Promethearchaeota archaeon]